MKVLTLGLTLVAVLVTAGCNPFRRDSGQARVCQEPEGYAQAGEVPPLAIPAGLEAPDTRNALRIPELTTPQPPPRTVDQGCLDQPPPYVIERPKEPEA